MNLAAQERCAAFASPDWQARLSAFLANEPGAAHFSLAELAALLDSTPQDVLAELTVITPPADSFSLDTLLNLAYRLPTPRAKQVRQWVTHQLAHSHPITPQLPPPPAIILPPTPRLSLGRRIANWFFGWLDIVYFAVLMLVLALSPSSYAPRQVQSLLRLIYLNVWLVLPWFLVLCTLLSLVLIQIVVVSVASYGLSRYALEMVVRVLVLELIPLGTALFVIFGPGAGNANAALGQRFSSNGRASDVLTSSDVPGVVAQSFAVLTMAALSSVVALLLAYLLVYGFSPWGLTAYTRMVGRVFNLPVSILFALKIVFLSLAVAIVPLACARQQSAQLNLSLLAVPQGTIRLFSVIILIEIASLAIRYI